MKTSERLLKKLRKLFPDNAELQRQDLFLFSNKAYVRFAVCYNWSSNGIKPVFSYHTMTDCLKAKSLSIIESYENGCFCGWLVAIDK